MALRAHQGQVWAIEKKEDAVELIHRNKVKFAADNLEIVEGLAPEALKDLPAPTHAFIGGSSGNLKEIVKLLLEKNSHVRIVINLKLCLKHWKQRKSLDLKKMKSCS